MNRIELRERANRNVSVSVVLWRGSVPFHGLRRYLWDRLWSLRYGDPA